MNLTDYAKRHCLPLEEVRRAARACGITGRRNVTLTEAEQATLDRRLAEAAETLCPRVFSPADSNPLPEYFTVELPLCLLGRRTVRVSRGETLAAREAAAFELYKQAGGIRESRFNPIISPIDTPDASPSDDILEQETV